MNNEEWRLDMPHYNPPGRLPKYGEVWGNPLEPETWRFVIQADRDSVSIRSFHSHVHTAIPKHIWDDWITFAHVENITHIMKMMEKL